MKYKNTRRRSRRNRYTANTARERSLRPKELVKYKNDTNMAVTMITAEYKGGFGTAGSTSMFLIGSRPLLRTINTHKRKQIRNICRQSRTTYGAINNTPERSIETVETYKVVYEKVLDANQKKHVNPK